jgi:hypothetical protein
VSTKSGFFGVVCCKQRRKTGVNGVSVTAVGQEDGKREALLPHVFGGGFERFVDLYPGNAHIMNKKGMLRRIPLRVTAVDQYGGATAFEKRTGAQAERDLRDVGE